MTFVTFEKVTSDKIWKCEMIPYLAHAGPVQRTAVTITIWPMTCPNRVSKTLHINPFILAVRFWRYYKICYTEFSN